MIRFLIDLLANAPADTTLPETEYTLVAGRDKLDVLKSVLSSGCSSERTQEPLRGAPCLLVPHASALHGNPERNLTISAAYFDLLCTSRGLGTAFFYSTSDIQELHTLLEIPPDHSISVMVAFGWPEIPYARGSQRRIPESRIHYPDLVPPDKK